MQHYQNFKIASYVRGEFLAQTDLSEIQKGIDFFKQYLGLDKVYLDTHREIYDVPKDKLQKIKKMFQEAGIQISGAITCCFSALPFAAYPASFGRYGP